MAEETKFLFQGSFIDKREAAQKSIMVVGDFLPSEAIALTFDSNVEFHKWLEYSKHAEQYYRIEKTIEVLRQREHAADQSRAQRRLRATVDRVTRELKEFAADFDLDPDVAGYELFLKATVERDPLEPPIFDPVILFENAGARGAWLPISDLVYFPDLRWIGWNDRASSVAVFGSGCLFQDVWFGGPRLYFWGAPWAFNLAEFGWNDRASSVAA
jgi:hypothetical protein